MENDIKKTLDNFLDDEDNEKEVKKNEKKIKKDKSIIERVDKVILVEDGRQLLREHY